MLVSTFSVETDPLKATRNDLAGLNSEAQSAVRPSFGVILKVSLPLIVLQVSYLKT